MSQRTMRPATARLVGACLTLVAIAFAPVRAETGCPSPRCLEDAVAPVPSGLGLVDVRFRVILPPGYDEEAPVRYPVLYLLHGAGDTFRTWTDRTDLVAFTAGLHEQGRDVIVVTPDGGGTAADSSTGEPGWYSDWHDGSRRWETFHVSALIPYVESRYRADPARRLVAGLSMGGYGALKYAARHPGVFDAAASFSGAVDTMYGYPLSAVAFAALHDSVGTPDDRVWGNPVLDVAVWRENNPADPANAAALAGTPVFLATGQGIPIGAHDAPGDLTDPGRLGGYGLEHFIFQMNVSFAARLTALGVEHSDDFYPGGSHSWPYWQDALHRALPRMLDAAAG